MDTLLRVLSYLLVGTLLIIVNLWFIQSVRQALIGHTLVIAPFQVSGTSPDAVALGASLAQMLQARLGHLQHRLTVSQEFLVGLPSPGDRTSASAEDPRALMLLRPVLIPTAVLEPVSIDVKLAGVEVGGIFTWLQRAVVRPRTLTFTAYVAPGPGKSDAGATTHAIVTGNLEAFSNRSSRAFWLETGGTPEAIVDATAHALIQRRLSEMGLSEVDAFDVDEFNSLLGSLFSLAELNRRVASGRSAGDGFAKLLAPLSALVEKTPQWYELRYLTANVAENAGRPDLALGHYQELVKGTDTRAEGRRPVGEALRARAETRLQEMSKVANLAEPPAAFVASMTAYARRLNLPGGDPSVVFTQSKGDGMLAIWKSEEKRYEINSASAGYAGLDRYVALMGRFMAKHFDRCFEGRPDNAETTDLWQEVRSSLVEYVISTEPDSPGPSDQRAYGMALFKTLQQMEGAPGTSREDVRRLALELLDRYDCAWTRKTLASHVLKAAADLGRPPEEVVRRAFGPTSR